MSMIQRLMIGFICFASPIICMASSNWQIDQAKSSLSFTATQNNAPVTGVFKVFSGDINFNPNDLPHGNIKIIVDMNSVSTSYKEVADALKTADFFDPKEFPQATFIASDFKKENGNSYEADGKLTLRDKTLPLTLHFVLEKYSEAEAIAKGTATLKRTDFGVGKGEWSSTKQIKDNVVINFMIDATQVSGKK